ncbi:MAG: hypothetical protein FJY91_03055 [Candidatus Harrisonbacteria bacterium]|nr:hypothetical protein [Candidatus Harrisonbacteria bacterium]
MEDISGWADWMLVRVDIPCSAENKEISLILRLDKHWGFTGVASTSKIYARAHLLGLDICPAEVGPTLRLQYLNQPANDHFQLTM